MIFFNINVKKYTNINLQKPKTLSIPLSCITLPLSTQFIYEHYLCLG